MLAVLRRAFCTVRSPLVIFYWRASAGDSPIDHHSFSPLFLLQCLLSATFLISPSLKMIAPHRLKASCPSDAARRRWPLERAVHINRKWPCILTARPKWRCQTRRNKSSILDDDCILNYHFGFFEGTEKRGSGELLPDGRLSLRWSAVDRLAAHCAKASTEFSVSIETVDCAFRSSVH